VTERGTMPDASLACPFVAFDDDRDARAAVPDHRHRCFAEVRPAPRAIAHQERFCLSAGFAGCPTFQDWARREAARVRTPPRPAAPEAGLAAAAAAILPASTPPERPSDGPAVPTSADDGPTDVDAPEVWPRRPGGRDWAAPPPWTAGTSAVPGGSPEVEPSDTTTDHGPAAAADASDAQAPAFLAGREPSPDDARPPRPPERAPHPPERPPSRSEYDAAVAGAGLAAATPRPSSASEAAIEGPDDDEEPPLRRFGTAPGRAKTPPPSTRQEPPRRPPADPGAPAWERPRRFEAYPTIKTRAGLPSLSPLLLAVGGIAIAAIALFTIPPMLLGLGGDEDGTTPRPSASSTASPTVAPSPSPSPSPTPLVYVIQSGDTLSKIAAQFGVSLDDLIAANAETIPDPDNIQVGDQLIIPTTPPDEIPNDASPSPAASP
jgi:LysM repeat protein